MCNDFKGVFRDNYSIIKWPSDKIDLADPVQLSTESLVTYRAARRNCLARGKIFSFEPMTSYFQIPVRHEVFKSV